MQIRATIALSVLAGIVTSLDLTVTTTNGLITGHRAPNATKVYEYLGIPFAQAPIGDLRFAPPEKIRSTTSKTPYIAQNFVSHVG